MRVSDIAVINRGAEFCQLQARVESDFSPNDAHWWEPFLLWYRYPSWCRPLLSETNGDPFLAALLVGAMRSEPRLVISAPVSPRLREALPEIQAIYKAFDGRAKHIPVEVATRKHSLPTDGGPGVGLFFSLGVDSFYSLLKNARISPPNEWITHLVAIHGMDVLPGRQSSDFPPGLLRNSERVARETGCRLLPVATNIRRFTEPIVGWPMSHGGALASIALALAGLLDRILIAASTTYDQLYPWGTHPALDPLWSTEELTVIHDGCELARIDKVAFIADNDLVLDTLRVCPDYTAAYNCGRCVKCLPTMIDLMQLGVLERSPVFPHTIDVEALRGMLRAHRGGLNVENYERRLAQPRSINRPFGNARGARGLPCLRKNAKPTGNNPASPTKGPDDALQTAIPRQLIRRRCVPSLRNSSASYLPSLRMRANTEKASALADKVATAVAIASVWIAEKAFDAEATAIAGKKRGTRFLVMRSTGNAASGSGRSATADAVATGVAHLMARDALLFLFPLFPLLRFSVDTEAQGRSREARPKNAAHGASARG